VRGERSIFANPGLGKHTGADTESLAVPATILHDIPKVSCISGGVPRYMNNASAYCPACHNIVTFLKTGETAACPVCGFKYQLSTDTKKSIPSAPLPFMSFLKVLLIVSALVVGLGAVVLAVVFVGCMRLMKNV
jgi:hypothetical protein